MKKLIILCLITSVFISCKNKSETDNTRETVDTNVPSPFLEVGCYAYKGHNNSIELKITEMNDMVAGYLNYHLAEKDANTGTFRGIVDDDVLLAEYTFQSEGTTSKREVIFKVINDELIEGYGEMDAEGTHFRNTDHVSFSSTMPLTKTDCNH
ncbi:hypothetical protein [Confluentibacter sediminis]|uniref:hypothetical protein n=1 Tax=Confluentibacter sediminis TaxID=2219045 RepID=UPI000DACA301|nr:hypothetical protein [Confluentibacter sediminis]